MTPSTDPIVVCGAGLAGLALAAELLDGGERREVVLVDRRRGWSRDRTWCAWDVGDPLPAAVADARWTSWEVRARGRRVRATARRHLYLHVRGDLLYEALLERLGDQVTWRLGEAVQDLRDDGAAAVVRTASGALRASVAVDAMGGGGPLLRGRPPGEVELRQRFLGWEVRTERPVFDPGTAVLMDFDAVPAAPGEARFLYVLPFAPDRALVEDTVIGRGPHAAARARATLDGWLARRGAGAYEVLHEERGAIAMTTWPFPAVRSPRLVAAGAAAGGVRPSSGYGLVRTLRHARALARALAGGGSLPTRAGGARAAALDRVFLRALDPDPGAFAGWAAAMAAGVPADVFARFMADASSPADELRVIAALPPAPFAGALLPRRPEAAAVPGRLRAV